MVINRYFTLWTIEILQQISNDRRPQIRRLDFLVRFLSRQNERMKQRIGQKFYKGYY